MAKLTGPLLTSYRNGLRKWPHPDYVFYTEVAERWLRKELRGHTQRRFGETLHLFVEAGGEVDRRWNPDEKY